MAEQLNQYSYMGLAMNIVQIASNNRATDDTPLSVRQIIFWIKNTFSEIMANDIERKKQGLLNFSIDPFFVNDLGCIPVFEMSDSDCGCIRSGCKVYATNPLPKFMALFGEPMIQYVGDINGKSPYNKTTARGASGTVTNRFMRNSISYYYSRDRIYIVIPPDRADVAVIKCINVQAVTDDIMATTPQCGDNGEIVDVCFDIWSEEANIPKRYINAITENIIQKYIGVQLQAPEDKKNDGSKN